MDEYSIKILGQDLDVDYIVKSLDKLDPNQIYHQGNSFFSNQGKVRKNKSGRLNPIGIVSFGSPFPNLLDLLNYIDGNSKHLSSAGSDSIEIWALMYRSGQINGELSALEIQLLAKIGAAFCWSVIN